MFKKNGWLVQDKDAKFYIYAQTMNGRTQYGIVGAAACEDYNTGIRIIAGLCNSNQIGVTGNRRHSTHCFMSTVIIDTIMNPILNNSCSPLPTAISSDIYSHANIEQKIKVNTKE